MGSIGRNKPPPPPPKLFGLLPPRKQNKKPWERWLRKLELRFSKKSPAQHVEAFHGAVTSAFRNELAGRFAAAILAKKTLDTTRQVEEPFPDRYFDGAALVDAAGRAELEAYATLLAAFHERCLEAETPLGLATAQGVETWIASIYGLTYQELTPKVREAWVRLVQGEPGLDEAYRLLVRRAPSEIERVYFHYRPKALIGGE